MKDIGVNRNYDFSKYDINTFDGDIMLQGLSKDLIDKAWEKYQDYKVNKAQYFVGSDIVNNAQHTMTCYVDIKDQPLRHILYHDYLHWCSTMKRDPNVSFGGRAGGPTDENGNYYTFAHPRVIAKDAWEIERAQQLALMGGNLADEITVSLDGYYIDSFDKWQRYVNVGEDNNPSIYVQFYKGNLILTLGVDDVVPKVTIETNAAHYFYLYDEETRIKKWKEYLAADIPKWQAQRKEAEDILRAKGYTIDESYIDAPLSKEFLEWQQAEQPNSK